LSSREPSASPKPPSTTTAIPPPITAIKGPPESDNSDHLESKSFINIGGNISSAEDDDDLSNIVELEATDQQNETQSKTRTSVQASRKTPDAIKLEDQPIDLLVEKTNLKPKQQTDGRIIRGNTSRSNASKHYYIHNGNSGANHKIKSRFVMSAAGIHKRGLNRKRVLKSKSIYPQPRIDLAVNQNINTQLHHDTNVSKHNFINDIASNLNHLVSKIKEWHHNKKQSKKNFEADAVPKKNSKRRSMSQEKY